MIVIDVGLVKYKSSLTLAQSVNSELPYIMFMFLANVLAKYNRHLSFVVKPFEKAISQITTRSVGLFFKTSFRVLGLQLVFWFVSRLFVYPVIILLFWFACSTMTMMDNCWKTLSWLPSLLVISLIMLEGDFWIRSSSENSQAIGETPPSKDVELSNSNHELVCNM